MPIVIKGNNNMPTIKDANWTDRLDKALKGEITGIELTEIPDETNDEGQVKVIHHFKSKKVYVQGSSKQKRTVPEAEAKQILLDRKAARVKK